MKRNPEKSEKSHRIISLVNKLTRLYDLHFKLALIDDMDELCRQVVDKGREYTGFDRLSLWFIDPEDPLWLKGSFGIDERGQIRNEKGFRMIKDPSMDETILKAPVSSRTWRSTVILDRDSRSEGASRRAVVPIWNGRQTIGLLCGENGPEGDRIPEEESQILLILARTVGHLITIIRNETILKENAARMEQLASFDGLTGLYSRTIGTRLLYQQISMANRNRSNLIIRYMDLDRLKEVNDSQGHNRGDDFIRLIADKIKACIRQSDIACRMGGDEFMIALPDSRMEEARVMIERLLQTARQDTALLSIKQPPWFSYGFSELETAERNPEDPDIDRIIHDLIHEADIEMYRWKKDHKI